MRIYLDNCCYNRPFDNQKDTTIFAETQAKLEIQTLIKSKTFVLVYSAVSVQEILDSPFESTRNFIMDFVQMNATYYVGASDTVAALTEEIMRTGIKLKDASHVACAVVAQCEYFITTDKRLLKYKDRRVKVVNPIDFLAKWRLLYV